MGADLNDFGVKALVLAIALALCGGAGAEEDPVFVSFQRGVKSFQQKQFDAAVAALIEIPELGAGYLSLYKHWFLGHAYMEIGKYKEAEPEFAKVMNEASATEMKYQAQFAMAEAALRQKKYRDTELRLQPLERKWRRSYRLPEVLHRLVVANVKMGQLSKACRRAERLYTQYPGHPLVLDWGSNLALVEVDGVKLGCTTGKGDFPRRLHNLQRSGEAVKAQRELTALIGKSPDGDRFELDMLLAGFLGEEGSVEEALKILVRYYPKQKSNINYLNLLGKTSGRSGEYQVAVGAYERIYNLSPKSGAGREALFKAAYLSYQFQDYDGAVRKFEQLIRTKPRAGLVREAQWHLAWLQYLRHDYRGAIQRFNQVAGAGKSRKRPTIVQERLLYWSAMAHLRLEKFTEAQAQFMAIFQRNPYSYYGLAAQARLEIVAAKISATQSRIPASLKLMPFGNESERPILLDGAVASRSLAEAEAELSEDVDSEEGSIETADSEATPPPAEEGDTEGGVNSELKDPVLRGRLDVAQKLIQLGLNDLARWELLEVERHTRNRQYLRSLLPAYERIGSYNRAATLAELTFGKEREASGLDGARALWLSMYPQAYKIQVEAMAKRYGVATEWVWSIMRAESLYRPDVISPVGARGLMQVMPYTAQHLVRLSDGAVGEDYNLLDPNVNILLGAQYLGRLAQKFKGSLPLVAASYNAGPHRVEGWLVNFGQLDMDEFVEHIPFQETRNYVKKVVRHHTLYRRLYAKDEKSVDLLAKALGVPIPTRAATRENWESM